jgi:hypothetical protein
MTRDPRIAKTSATPQESTVDREPQGGLQPQPKHEARNPKS